MASWNLREAVYDFKEFTYLKYCKPSCPHLMLDVSLLLGSVIVICYGIDEAGEWFLFCPWSCNLQFAQIWDPLLTPRL